MARDISRPSGGGQAIGSCGRSIGEHKCELCSSQLFLKEVEVWRRLRSPFVLPFLGASSTTGPPPWFLISPYSRCITFPADGKVRHGSIVEYLQTDMGKTANKFSIIHQIAMGMDYLHSRDVLHGDLKVSWITRDTDSRLQTCCSTTLVISGSATLACPS